MNPVSLWRPCSGPVDTRQRRAVTSQFWCVHSREAQDCPFRCLRKVFCCCCFLVAKSCLTLLQPRGAYVACQAPLSMGFPSAISFSRGSCLPRGRTSIPCISRWILYTESPDIRTPNPIKILSWENRNTLSFANSDYMTDTGSITHHLSRGFCITWSARGMGALSLRVGGSFLILNLQWCSLHVLGEMYLYTILLIIIN